MTPIRETIARAYVETIIGKPDPDWAAHWQWYLDGAGNPDSCVHYSNHGRGAQHADAVVFSGLDMAVQAPAGMGLGVFDKIMACVGSAGLGEGE